MSSFEVKFFNKVSGWIHSAVVLVADDVMAAEKAARRAFDEVYAYTAPWVDQESGVYHPEKGTPGHDSTLYSTAVTPVETVASHPLDQAVNKLFPPVSVGGVQQSSVTTSSVPDGVVPIVEK